MANKPTLQFDADIDIAKAIRQTQDILARRPLNVKLAVDAKGLDGINKGLGKLSGSADEFTKSLEAANARVLAFGASVAVISAIQRGFVNLVKSTIEVEAAFAKIAVVGDQFAATAGQLEKFGRGVFDVARQTGQSFDETSKAALEFARQGLGAAETLVRVKDALTLTRLSGLDATSSVEGLTAAVNSFKKEGLSTTDVLNKLIAVDNKYAVSSGDLIEAIKRSGAFAQEAGVGFDELTATVTVLQEATARGGSVIGNSLKTIFERVGRPESIKQLRDLKVSVDAVGGGLLPAIKILDNFSNKLNGMDEASKRAATRQLAGTLQINQLSALSNALKEVEGGSRRYDEVLATSANASIEAATANEKLNQTLDAQIKSLLATGTQLGSLFGNITIGPALKNITGALGSVGEFLIEGLSKEGPTFTKALSNIIGDAILVAGAAGALSIGLILKKFAIFAKDSFSNVLGINAATKNQEAIQVSILNTLRTRGDIEQQLLSLGGNQVAQAQLLAKAYKDAADQDARRVASSKVYSTLLAPSFGIGPSGQPSPRGKKGFGAAKGYVPDLIQAEYSDIKKGVGGANKNAGVVLINDFPFGGGKKGPMVANTSEGIVPMGSNGAAVLNKDMLDNMGYGQRAAKGTAPSISFSDTSIAAKSGKFISTKKLESVVEQTAKTLSEQNVAGLNFTNALNKAIKESGFELTGSSLKNIGKVAIQFSKNLKSYDQAVKESVFKMISNAKGGSLSSFGAAGKIFNEKSDKIAQKLAQKEQEKLADQKIAEAKKSQKDFEKKFPVTAQLGRDQQLKARGQLLPPVSGGFGVFGRLSAEDIKKQNRQQLLSRAGNVLAAGSFDSNIGYSSKIRERAMDASEFFLNQGSPRDLKTGNIGYKKTFGGNPDLRRDALASVSSAFKERASQARAERGVEYKRQYDERQAQLAQVRSRLSSRYPDRQFKESLAGPGNGLRNVDSKFKVQTVDDVSRSLADLSPVIEQTKKTFNEAAISFGSTAGSIFFGSSILKNTLEASGVEVGKFADVIRDAAIGVVAFKEINKFKGKGSGSSLSNRLLGEDFSKGRRLGSREGPLSGAEIDFLGQNKRAKRGFQAEGLIGGAKRFGSSLLGLLPAVGQLTAGLFVANSVLEAFGIDAWGAIKNFVTGLSEEGRKAKDSLTKFSESLFESGQFVGRTGEDASKSLQLKIQEQKELVRAKNLGVETQGKSAAQISGENFAKELSKSLANVKTGGKVAIREEVSLGAGDTGFIKTGKFRDELFSELNQTTQQVVLDSISEIFALNEEELKSLAKRKNVKTNGSENRGQLAQLVSQEALNSLTRSGALNFVGKDLSNFGANGSSVVQRQVAGFINPEKQARSSLKARNPESFASLQTVQAEVSAAIQLKKLQLDFSTEAERVLETRIKTAQISDVERANLQANLEDLKLERSLRGDIFDVATKNIEKLANTEGSDIKVEELKSGIQQIQALGLGVNDTKEKVKSLFDTLSGDSIVETIKSETLAQLDGLKENNNERREQLRISNEQAQLEARISESLRVQQNLLSSRSDIRNARIGIQKTSLESRISSLDAKSSSPNLSIQQQNALRKEGNALRLESFDLDKRSAESEKKAAEDSLRLKKDLSDIDRKSAQKKIDLDFQRTTESINSQIEALKIQSSQIEASASAMTLLANAAFQFKQNLGELESSNILAALRATDSSSLGSALSSQQAFGDLQASGKTGLDAEQLLAERTALRQKEFEIASATTNVQKIQLSQEQKALEDIISIKERGGSADEQIAALIEAQNKRLKEQRTLRSGVNNATAQMRDEINTFGSDFGETATFGFKDALSDALKAAADGTGDLKNSLLDVALSFANKLRDAAIDNLAKIATNALFSGGGDSGGGNVVSSVLSGLFQKRASGGPITGGSGTKDDVPILGMGGEFMINKRMVKKYGPQLFEDLNEGRIQKMAAGGLVDPSISGKAIRGSKNLLDYATQNSTSGASDKILSLGGNAGLVELEPESLRLTNFARQSGNPLQSATQEAKDQALGLVFQDRDLRKQYKEQLDAIAKAKKEKQKQLLISAAISVAGAAVGSYFQTPGGTGSIYGQDQLPTYDANLNYLGLTGRDSSRISSGLSNRSIIRSTSSASNISAGTTRALSGGNLPLPNVGMSEIYRPNQIAGTYNGLIPSLRSSGGVVNGNGYGDNVPALLNGGEGVLNPRAMKNLGVSKLNAINAGQSTGVSDEKSEELNEKLLAKLDELAKSMSSQNNVTVNVSMDKNGKSTASESGQQNEDQKNMNRRIKDAVVQILQEEKRLGGTLRGK